ncbi:GNAT family N-acetyltransferase [Paenibacillus sp. GD4]|uniref:GNAT family N-acetyltransferase n=1 Tax=Paenibacillus sp. GD4 TaxID=3068890 RepID=UPI0027966537|nr:GNAT family N-acetyltransferase [Paenibacillus sp. GD4]MDQ1914365.1 GNAT family N-acetyltransferase [Paenibacillus sp. GD4]
MKISIEEKDISEISLIKPLWEGLRNYHNSLPNGTVSNKQFEERVGQLEEKAKNGKIQILIAVDDQSGTYIGYSISTISKENEGELDSLFLLEQYRSQGIGDMLMNKSMGWFDENGVNNIRILVSYLNGDAVKFYKKFKFEPISLILKRQ